MDASREHARRSSKLELELEKQTEALDALKKDYSALESKHSLLVAETQQAAWEHRHASLLWFDWQQQILWLWLLPVSKGLSRPYGVLVVRLNKPDILTPVVPTDVSLNINVISGIGLYARMMHAQMIGAFS